MLSRKDVTFNDNAWKCRNEGVILYCSGKHEHTICTFNKRKNAQKSSKCIYRNIAYGTNNDIDHATKDIKIGSIFLSKLKKIIMTLNILIILSRNSYITPMKNTITITKSREAVYLLPLFNLCWHNTYNFW